MGRPRGGTNLKTVHTALRELRRKLGDNAGNRKYILSERGLGCRMPGPEDARGRK